MQAGVIADALKSTIVRVTSLWAGAGPAVSDPPRVKGVPAIAKAATREAAPYPAELESVARLGDGSHVRVRPIRPDDEARLVALFERLSPRTIYQRFFTTYRQLPSAWYRDFANVDYRARMALVAEDVGPAGRLRGVARWEPADTPDTAELAIVVEDEWQGRGLGTVLLEHLFEAAARRGIRRLCADVLAENDGMLRLLRRVGTIDGSRVEQGVVRLSLVPRVA